MPTLPKGPTLCKPLNGSITLSFIGPRTSTLGKPCKRIYLLYTGQHYDPIVSGPEAGVPVEQEQKKQKKGGRFSVCEQYGYIGLI